MMEHFNQITSLFSNDDPQSIMETQLSTFNCRKLAGSSCASAAAAAGSRNTKLKAKPKFDQKQQQPQSSIKMSDWGDEDTTEVRFELE